MDTDTWVFWQTVFTVLVPLCFLAIVVWAWSGKRKQDFHEAANLPLTEDEPPSRRAARKEGRR